MSEHVSFIMSEHFHTVHMKQPSNDSDKIIEDIKWKGDPIAQSPDKNREHNHQKIGQLHGFLGRIWCERVVHDGC